MADRIERIELFHVDVPLPTPFFPLWVRGFPQRNLRHTLLRLTTRDGHVGHATGAAFDRERAGLGDLIGPFLLGLDPSDPLAAAERLEQAAFLGWQNRWIETAFFDLAAQARGAPMWRVIAEVAGAPLASADVGPVRAYASFGELRSPKARGEAIERAQRAGFRAVKIGLDGPTLEDDVAATRSAREAGSELELLVHAYQARRVSLVEDHLRWDLSRALAYSSAAEALGVAWLQEPLPIWSASWSAERARALAELASRSKVPLAGGDIATSLLELETVVERGLYQTLTPDVSFAGVLAAARLMRSCLARGAGFSPRSYGDGVALAANLHALLAWSALEGTKGPKLLELPWEPPAMTPGYRDALLEAPIEIDGEGLVAPPEGPGLGVAIGPRQLKRYAQRFYTLTPVRFAVTARRSGLAEGSDFIRAPRRARRGRAANA